MGCITLPQEGAARTAPACDLDAGAPRPEDASSHFARYHLAITIAIVAVFEGYPPHFFDVFGAVVLVVVLPIDHSIDSNFFHDCIRASTDD